MAPEPKQAGQPRVMVIEDDPDCIAILTAMLQTEGYRVDVHPDGAGAYGLVKHTRPDIVVLDLNLPDRSGWDIFQALRLDPDTAGIPVLVCSSAQEDLLRRSQRLRSMNADALPKPFTGDALLRKIRQLVGSPAV